MVKTKNEKLFKLVMNEKFETGEYNFETPYGSVKLVKAWPVWCSKFSVDKVNLFLNDELILTFKKCSSWFDPYTYETLYGYDGENRIELRNNLQSEENNLTITAPASSLAANFLITDLEHNKFEAVKDDAFPTKFEAQLIDNELYGENMSYNLANDTMNILIHTDNDVDTAVPINPYSTVAFELAKLKDKLDEAKRKDTLGLLVATIFEQYSNEKKLSIANLDMEERVLKAIAEFYNTYHTNKEKIFERLDSNPVFKEVEKYVERILQEQELVAAQEKVNAIKSRIRELEN